MTDAVSDATPTDEYGPDSLDRFKSKRKPAAPATTKPRNPTKPGRPAKRLWGKVFLDDVLDRRQDVTFSAPARLFVYLYVKSYDGKHAVALTNAMAEEVGLDRAQKCRALRHLEEQGYVTVERRGQEAPLVTVSRRGS